VSENAPESTPEPQPQGEAIRGSLQEVAEIAQAVGAVITPVAAYYGGKLAGQQPPPPPPEPPQVELPPGVPRD
jgi:hypothetical protein